MDEDDLLRSFFEQMRGRRTESSYSARGDDQLYRMEVSFRDAVLGGEREITLPSGKRFQVKIPAGVTSGKKLRLAGQGEAGSRQAQAGDVYIELVVTPSPIFKREENDLFIELPISIPEAILGAEIKVPTVDGLVLLKIPPGVSSGSKLRLSGKGVLNASTQKRGDQYVVLKVVSPPNADADIRQAIQSWNQRQPFDARAGWIGAQGAFQ